MDSNISGSTIQALSQVLADLQVYNMVVIVAALAVALYDAVLCFPDEFRLVWSAEWTVGKFLYIGCRYLIPAYLAACLHLGMMTDCSDATAKVWVLPTTWLAGICYLCPLALVGLRTYAMFSGNKMAKWIIIAMFVAQVIILFVMFSIYSVQARFVSLEGFGLPCFISVSFAPRLPELVAYIGEFTLELILWIMSLAKLLPVVLRGQRNTVKILLWDGALYCTVVNLLLLSEVILSVFVGEGESVLSSITAPMILGVVCVLSSRQILHLRDHVSGRSLMETRCELATDLTESKRSGVYHDM